jgi:hypothetical protein
VRNRLRLEIDVGEMNGLLTGNVVMPGENPTTPAILEKTYFLSKISTNKIFFHMHGRMHARARARRGSGGTAPRARHPLGRDARARARFARVQKKTNNQMKKYVKQSAIIF